MDELVYNFLLQSGYPRAAIVTDLELLGDQPTNVLDAARPGFAVVDPETTDRLAVISVTGAIDKDTLMETAASTALYADHLGGRPVQGFVIRIDMNGRSNEEKIQFYRVWPNPHLQQLTARTFPDLESLRVVSMLSMPAIVAPADIVESSVESPEDLAVEKRQHKGPGFGAYLPGLALLVLLLVDWYLEQRTGGGLLTMAQSLLAVGCAALLSAPGLLRRHNP